MRTATTALAAASVLALAHVLARVPSAAVDLSRVPPAEVTPALRDRLARLDEELLLTYAATRPAAMPSGLRGVPGRVETLLRSVEAAGAGRVRVQVVDPDRDADTTGYLAAVGLAPFRARALELDREVERSVWSGLRIDLGSRGAAVVPAVTPATLPGLQALIAAHLDLLEHPRRPRIALAAPLDFQQLRRTLREHGEVLECDFGVDAQIPDEADLLLWIEPGPESSGQVEALRAFLDRGGSAVVAGGVLAPVARTFGVVAAHGSLVDGEGDEASPLVRSIGSDQDFRPLAVGGRGAPQGTLLFASPTPLQPAARRLHELGLSMHALASSSSGTRFLPFGSEATAARAPRSTLLALLAPDEGAEPFRGRLVLAASSSPFSDAYLRHEAFAHQALLAGLVRSLASPERLAAASASVPAPERIPGLGATEQGLLRIAVGLLLPLLVAVAWLGLAGRAALPLPRVTAAAVGPGLLGVALLALARIVPASLAVDLSRDGRNGLAPETRALLVRDATAHGPARIELLLPPDAELPPSVRGAVRDARVLASRLADAARGLTLVDAAPDAADAATIEALARDGILPVELAPGEPPVFAAIRVEAGGAKEVLRFADPAGFDHLEYRLAAALERLRGAESRPIVAVAAPPPRPTPAEALRYQRRGRFPPGGSDVFAEARALLEANDLDVRSLNPAAPDLPEGTAALVLLQPRRDARPLLAAALRHLEAGGGVLIAAQEHGVRQRRLQDRALGLALRPEPWFPDLDRSGLAELGVGLAPELVLDERHGTAPVATEVEIAAGEFETVRERATGPLFVRAEPPDPDGQEPGLDLPGPVLACPSRVVIDAGKLASRGFVARTLLASSDRAWTVPWKGGDLPGDALRGPAELRFEGPFPLAVRVEGAQPGDGSGRLALIGCSEVFRDGALHAGGDEGAQLLLHLVGSLALRPEIAAILARSPSSPAIGLVGPRATLLARVLVVAGAPAVLLLLGLLYAAHRRRTAGRSA